jgi:hypothetical protein
VSFEAIERRLVHVTGGELCMMNSSRRCTSPNDIGFYSQFQLLQLTFLQYNPFTNFSVICPFNKPDVAICYLYPGDITIIKTTAPAIKIGVQVAVKIWLCISLQVQAGYFLFQFGCFGKCR